MLQARLKLLKNQKGMTLIELMAVVVIIGIIVAIAIPLVAGAVNKSRGGADSATDKAVFEATQRYIIDNESTYGTKTGDQTINVSVLVSAGYLDSAPKKQSGDNAGKSYATVIVTRVAVGDSWKLTSTGFTYS